MIGSLLVWLLEVFLYWLIMMCTVLLCTIWWQRQPRLKEALLTAYDLVRPYDDSEFDRMRQDWHELIERELW